MTDAIEVREPAACRKTCGFFVSSVYELDKAKGPEALLILPASGRTRCLIHYRALSIGPTGKSGKLDLIVKTFWLSA